MSVRLSNAEIADRLFGLAYLLAARKENPFKVKAYRRAARTVRALGESVADLVREGADLTQYTGIGQGINGVIREIVETGTTRQFVSFQSHLSPELTGVLRFPQLDPKRVLRIYKKLKISTIDELKDRLESGEIGRALGPRMDQHVRRALAEHQEVLLYEADRTGPVVQEFLLDRCRVARAEPAGDYRRRVEVIREMDFLIETMNFPEVLAILKTYGGHAELLESAEHSALFKLSSGLLKVTVSPKGKWGAALIAATGSRAHLEKLEKREPGLTALFESLEIFPAEPDAYRKLGLSFIPPELRNGRDEIELAARGQLPSLLTVPDIRGELHAHTTSSDE